MKNGVDIVDISRLKKLNLDLFLNKYFSKREIEYINSKHCALQTIAGMFSAKEAFLKAVGIGIGNGINLKEIEILHSDIGQPYIDITPQINYYINAQNCSSISLSISHDGEYAVAFCIIF